ncbi:hypothetical protein V6N13_046317 [Hibiscus sabdariffa]|uniref:Uncharacterized protein n=1 Tax=Hibiscus sabdariffa TaxID=183260 RepID=A0ABR2D9S6_9ROSI
MSRKEHALFRWLCLARKYDSPCRTKRTALEDCNTSRCHVHVPKFLLVNQKEMKLQRAPMKKLEGWSLLSICQEIPWLGSKPQGNWKRDNGSDRMPTHSQRLDGQPKTTCIRNILLMKFEVTRNQHGPNLTIEHAWRNKK